MPSLFGRGSGGRRRCSAAGRPVSGGALFAALSPALSPHLSWNYPRASVLFRHDATQEMEAIDRSPVSPSPPEAGAFVWGARKINIYDCGELAHATI